MVKNYQLNLVKTAKNGVHIYEFGCTCGERLEVSDAKDPDPLECPNCGMGWDLYEDDSHNIYVGGERQTVDE
jgi:hypothetical protein